MNGSHNRLAGLGMSEAEYEARRSSIGGSDARILMSGDTQAIHQLWLEKSNLVARPDLSGNTLVELGLVTEELNRHKFETRTGWVVTDVQRKVMFEGWPRAHVTLDGIVREADTSEPMAVIECKFMQPFRWSIEAAREKYFPQVQHGLMVTGLDRGYLSVITGSGHYDYIEIEEDVFYQHRLLEIEKEFWDCVERGEPPGIASDVAVPVLPTRIVSMQGNNEWAYHADDLVRNRGSHQIYEKALRDIKTMMPADAKEAEGHGIKLKRSKSNAILVEVQAA